MESWMIGLFVIIAFFVWYTYSAIRKEKKRFNNGVCPRCNIRWVYDGYILGKSFKCKRCGRTINIMFNVDKDWWDLLESEIVKNNIKKYDTKIKG